MRNPTPWVVGKKTPHGTYSPNIVFDAKGESVFQIYGVPMNVTLEEIQNTRAPHLEPAELERRVDDYLAAIEQAQLTCDLVNAAANLDAALRR